MKEHYKTLGIAPQASAEEIKKAYFEMAKKYHPDSGDETEVKKFHEVTEAYKVLSDPASRKAYDLSLLAKSEDTEKVETAPKFHSTHESKRESYRDEELKEYHRNRYRKAVFRVVLFSLMLGLIGAIIAMILDGLHWLGGLAGICIGFSFSISQNFNVRSFFASGKMHKLFRVFTGLLFLGGFAYFVWLIVEALL